MAGKKGMKRYPVELKLEVVRLFYEERYMRDRVIAALHIRDPQRIQKWLAQYRAEGASAFAKPKGQPRRALRPQAELERLRMEVALLKKLQSELRERQFAQRNIGRSTTTGRTLP